MLKVAKSNCVICHFTKPRTEMKQRNFIVQSGNSIGISANTKRKNSTRVSTRSYFRNSKKWVCNDCWSSRPKYFSTVFFSLLANPYFLPKYRGYSKIGSFFYFITLGLFTLGWIVSVFEALFGNLKNIDGLPNSRLF